MREKLKKGYVEKARQLQREVSALQRRNKFFVIGELASFVAALAFVALAASTDGGSWWLTGSAICLLVYVLVRRQDAVNAHNVTQRQHLCSVYERETAYQEGRYDCFDDGRRYVDPHHPFTFDLDIFGPESLFQRVCRAVTTGGADRLAAALSQVDHFADHREALKELAAAESWRAKWLSMGQEKVVDTQEIRQTLGQVTALTLPRWFQSPVALSVAFVTLAGFYLSILLAVLGVIGATLPIVWGLIQLTVVVGLVSRSLKSVTKAVGRLHRQLSVYIELVGLMAQGHFESTELQALSRQLSGDCLHSFDLLGQLIRGIDQRSNEMGIVLFNVFGLMDFFLVRRFLSWKELYLDRFSHWLDALSQMDMLVSMATYRYNEPEAAEAQVVDSADLVFRARQMYHPFLSTASPVGNDFRLENRHFYIITGANMAGKSTFLRSLGINYVLAMNGMPVFAEELVVSPCRLFTSMRTSDDLAHGISYFNAELRRLAQLLDYQSASATVPMLVILDEILKGTNSLDKLNGSRLFLEEMAQRNVTGVVATHDLELSRMEGERFHNYCFEIELGSDVTYSYKLTPGVARNQNATFLLKQIIHR